MASLEKVLSETRKNKKTGGILIIVEGVYGIDGDVTHLEKLAGWLKNTERES